MSKIFRLNKSSDLISYNKKSVNISIDNKTAQKDNIDLLNFFNDNNEIQSKNTNKQKRFIETINRSKTLHRGYLNSSHDLGSRILKTDNRYNMNLIKKDFIVGTKVDSFLGGKFADSENIINQERSNNKSLCVRSSNIVGVYPYELNNSSKFIDKIITCAQNSGKTKSSRKVEDLKRTLYVQVNQMKRDYHTINQENLKNKTKARQLDKEINKLKQIVRQTKSGIIEKKFKTLDHDNSDYLKSNFSKSNFYLPTDPSGNLNDTNIRIVTQEYKNLPSEYNINTKLSLKDRIGITKEGISDIEREIEYCKNCLRDTNLTHLYSDKIAYKQKCSEIIKKTIKNSTKQIFFHNTQEENFQKQNEFLENKSVERQELLIQRGDIKNIVKKNENIFQNNIFKNQSVSLDEENFQLSEKENTIRNKIKIIEGNIQKKRKEISKQRKRNENMNKTFELKLSTKKTYIENSQDKEFRRNIARLQKMKQVVNKQESYLVLFYDILEECKFLFRNLTYCLQWKFCSKENFIELITPGLPPDFDSNENDLYINITVFDEILQQNVMKYLLPGGFSKQGERNEVVDLITKLFYICDRTDISRSEFKMKWEKLIPSFKCYDNEETLEGVRKDLISRKDFFYQDYEAVYTRIIEKIGFNYKKVFVSDQVVIDILHNKFTEDIRNVILLDVWQNSGNDCRCLDTQIFENVFYSFKKEKIEDNKILSTERSKNSYISNVKNNKYSVDNINQCKDKVYIKPSKTSEKSNFYTQENKPKSYLGFKKGYKFNPKNNNMIQQEKIKEKQKKLKIEDATKSKDQAFKKPYVKNDNKTRISRSKLSKYDEKKKGDNQEIPQLSVEDRNKVENVKDSIDRKEEQVNSNQQNEQEEDLTKKEEEEFAKKVEEEFNKKVEEEALQLVEEAKRKLTEELNKKVGEDALKSVEKAKRKLSGEAKQKLDEEEKEHKKAEEERRRKSEEETLKLVEEAKRRQAVEEETRMLAQDEQDRKMAEEERRRLADFEEERKLAAEEEKRRWTDLEEKRRLDHEEKCRLADEEERRRLADQEEKCRLDEEEKCRLADEKEKCRLADEEEKCRLADEEKKRRLDEEEKCRLADEEEKRKKEEQEKRRLAEQEELRLEQERIEKIGEHKMLLMTEEDMEAEMESKIQKEIEKKRQEKIKATQESDPDNYNPPNNEDELFDDDEDFENDTVEKLEHNNETFENDFEPTINETTEKECHIISNEKEIQQEEPKESSQNMIEIKNTNTDNKNIENLLEETNNLDNKVENENIEKNHSVSEKEASKHGLDEKEHKNFDFCERNDGLAVIPVVAVSNNENFVESKDEPKDELKDEPKDDQQLVQNKTEKIVIEKQPENLVNKNIDDQQVEESPATMIKNHENEQKVFNDQEKQEKENGLGYNENSEIKENLNINNEKTPENVEEFQTNENNKPKNEPRENIQPSTFVGNEDVAYQNEEIIAQRLEENIKEEESKEQLSNEKNQEANEELPNEKDQEENIKEEKNPNEKGQEENIKEESNEDLLNEKDQEENIKEEANVELPNEKSQGENIKEEEAYEELPNEKNQAENIKEEAKEFFTNNKGQKENIKEEANEELLNEKGQEENIKKEETNEELPNEKGQEENIKEEELPNEKNQEENIKEEETKEDLPNEKNLEEIIKQKANEELPNEKDQEENIKEEELPNEKDQEENIKEEEANKELPNEKNQEENIKEEANEKLPNEKDQEENIKEEEANEKLPNEKNQKENIKEEEETKEELPNEKGQEENIKEEELSNEKNQEENNKEEELQNKKGQEEKIKKEANIELPNEKDQEENIKEEENEELLNEKGQEENIKEEKLPNEKGQEENIKKEELPNEKNQEENIKEEHAKEEIPNEKNQEENIKEEANKELPNEKGQEESIKEEANEELPNEKDQEENLKEEANEDKNSNEILSEDYKNHESEKSEKENNTDQNLNTENQEPEDPNSMKNVNTEEDIQQKMVVTQTNESKDLSRMNPTPRNEVGDKSSRLMVTCKTAENPYKNSSHVINSEYLFQSTNKENDYKIPSEADSVGLHGSKDNQFGEAINDIHKELDLHEQGNLSEKQVRTKNTSKLASAR